MIRRTLAGTLSLAAAALGLCACTVEQTDWSNRTYTLAGSTCSEPSPVTVALKHGVGQATVQSGQVLVVRAEQVVKGEMTGGGPNEAAVRLSCQLGNVDVTYSNEIQVFTDGPKPLGRLLPPLRVGTSDSRFVDPMSAVNHHLVTGAVGFVDADHFPCCPSARDTYVWTWTGSSFSPNRQ